MAVQNQERDPGYLCARIYAQGSYFFIRLPEEDVEQLVNAKEVKKCSSGLQPLENDHKISKVHEVHVSLYVSLA